MLFISKQFRKSLLLTPFLSQHKINIIHKRFTGGGPKLPQTMAKPSTTTLPNQYTNPAHEAPSTIPNDHQVDFVNEINAAVDNKTAPVYYTETPVKTNKPSNEINKTTHKAEHELESKTKPNLPSSNKSKEPITEDTWHQSFPPTSQTTKENLKEHALKDVKETSQPHPPLKERYQYSSDEAQIPSDIRPANDPLKAYTDYTSKKEDEKPIELKNLADVAEQSILDTLNDSSEIANKGPIVTFRLNEHAIGDKKHVHFGEQNDDKTKMVSYGVLTSAQGHDPKTGEPSTLKISNVKMDGSFIKEPIVYDTKKEYPEIGYKPPSSIANENKEDYIAGFQISEKTAGQRVRVHSHPIEYSKEDYEISDLGMRYVHENNPTAKKNLTQIIDLVKKEEENKFKEDTQDNSTDD